MLPSRKTPYRERIPVKLTESEFDEFVLKHLPKKSYGPSYKIPLFKIFNYILYVLYTGCQWKMIPIEKDKTGKPEIHYTRIFRIFQKWEKHGSFVNIFENSVFRLHEKGLIDASVIHGDGTTTIAKKGGDCLGFSGHKHMKSEKIVAFCDRYCNVLSPMVRSPGNKHESPLFIRAFDFLKNLMKRIGITISRSIMSLDSAYDSIKNRKTIFNAGMIPNIKENKRNRIKNKRGQKRIFDEEIYEERFRTIEHVFAWEDKFKRLLVRFERKSANHFALKLIAYTMINLRHFCGQ